MVWDIRSPVRIVNTTNTSDFGPSESLLKYDIPLLSTDHLPARQHTSNVFSQYHKGTPSNMTPTLIQAIVQNVFLNPVVIIFKSGAIATRYTLKRYKRCNNAIP